MLVFVPDSEVNSTIEELKTLLRQPIELVPNIIRVLEELTRHADRRPYSPAATGPKPRAANGEGSGDKEEQVCRAAGQSETRAEAPGKGEQKDTVLVRKNPLPDESSRGPGPASQVRTLKHISGVNLQRSRRWHPRGIAEWSVSDWTLAMIGEAGDVCDKVKKLNHLVYHIQQAKGPTTYAEAISEIAQEIADTFLYLDLLCHRLDIDFELAIVGKFNLVSMREGFPERL